MKSLVLVLVLLLVLVLVLASCRSKAPACAKVGSALDPIAKELDAVAATAGTRAPPVPGEGPSCALLGDDARRVDGAQAKLSLLVSDDVVVAKHLDSYRQHVSVWAKRATLAHLKCLQRDGNGMTSEMTASIREHSELAPIAAQITDYCKAP